MAKILKILPPEGYEFSVTECDSGITINVTSSNVIYDQYAETETITINGVEFDAPERTEPMKGDFYYTIGAGIRGFCSILKRWDVTEDDIALLNNGLCFAKFEKCQAICNELNKIFRGEK